MEIDQPDQISKARSHSIVILKPVLINTAEFLYQSARSSEHHPRASVDIRSLNLDEVIQGDASQ